MGRLQISEMDRRTSSTSKCINHIANDEATDDANDRSYRDGCRWLAEGYTSDENHSLHSCMYLIRVVVGRIYDWHTPSLSTVTSGRMKSTHLPVLVRPSTPFKKVFRSKLFLELLWKEEHTFSVKSPLKLDPPLELCSVHLEHSNTHDKYKDSRNQGEYACRCSKSVD